MIKTSDIFEDLDDWRHLPDGDGLSRRFAASLREWADVRAGALAERPDRPRFGNQGESVDHEPVTP